ncbi:MAG: thioredoxin [Treponema sp.]|nr:thioredoxin [Treponema sp.]
MTKHRRNLMKEITITSQNWDAEVIKSEKPVLLDFWAPWCGPCKMLGPVVAEIAEEHDEIKVGKVNVDEESELAEQFGVMSIPTLVMMKEGKVVNSFTGFAPKESLENFING